METMMIGSEASGVVPGKALIGDCKCLDNSFPVFSTRLAAGLQPAAQFRRVANPARAMLENLWSSTYNLRLPT